MNDREVFAFALVLVMVFLVLSKVAYSIPPYAFDRLGVTQDFFGLVLWLLISTASFVTMFFSKKAKIIKSILLILITALLCSLSHYIDGVLGRTFDFVGVRGLMIIAPVFFMLSFASGLLGIFLSLPFISLRTNIGK